MPDFDILKTAGISQEVFASMVGVSRPTVNSWVTGRFSPTQKMRQRVSVALYAIADLVRAGHLPLRHDKTRAQLEAVEQQIAVITPAD